MFIILIIKFPIKNPLKTVLYEPNSVFCINIKMKNLVTERLIEVTSYDLTLNESKRDKKKILLIKTVGVAEMNE